MSTATPPYRAPTLDDHYNPFRWLAVGLMAMFVLIGLGIFFSIVYNNPPVSFNTPWTGWGTFWGWVLGALVLGIVVLIFLGIARNLIWGFGPRYMGRHYYRRMARWGYDPAVDAARERFARGEITREQLDQITSELERRPYPPFP